MIALFRRRLQQQTIRSRNRLFNFVLFIWIQFHWKCFIFVTTIYQKWTNIVVVVVVSVLVSVAVALSHTERSNLQCDCSPKCKVGQSNANAVWPFRWFARNDRRITVASGVMSDSRCPSSIQSSINRSNEIILKWTDWRDASARPQNVLTDQPFREPTCSIDWAIAVARIRN